MPQQTMTPGAGSYKEESTPVAGDAVSRGTCHLPTVPSLALPLHPDPPYPDILTTYTLDPDSRTSDMDALAVPKT